MTCHYDPSTERYSECDGHHRCICPDDEERMANNTHKPETVTASNNSHAAMAAEISDMRQKGDALTRELAALREVLEAAEGLVGQCWVGSRARDTLRTAIAAAKNRKQAATWRRQS